MSLNAIISAGSSGLHTAQTQLRAISDNIANVGTKGYVRKIVDQEPLVAGGISSGVTVAQVRLAADRFLQAAGLKATAQMTGSAATAGVWDQAQSLFGDPTGGGDFFSGLDKTFAAFSTLASNPTSSAARASAVDQAGQFFDRTRSISTQLDTLSAQADSRIAADIETANTLLARIDALNVDIARARLQGGDGTGPETQQMQLVDQLSGLIELQVATRNEGGVILRSADGLVLAGQGAAVLSYDPSGPVAELSVTPANGSKMGLSARIGSGEIKALVDLRNGALPQLKGQLAEMASGVADALNEIHNGYSSVPPPASLTGRATGQPLATAVGGFAGRTTVAILDAQGAIQRKVDIDFSAGTMSTDGGPAAAFTPASFVTSLNAALGGAGSASYSASGALTLSAAGGNGVAVAEPATGGSAKAGKGFSAFFGMNDLVTASVPLDYSSGLTATDPHGFTAGQTIKLRLSAPDGGRFTDVSVAVPAAGTMADLINALNQPSGGVGLYGQFSLAPDGGLAFSSGAGNTVSVLSDTTVRADGLSLSKAFGVGAKARGDRAASLAIRADIASDPARLSMAKVDGGLAVGARALSAGDARGADALGQAGQALHGFDAAGEMAAITQSLSEYASSFSGFVARKASAADVDLQRAEALSAEADARRSSVEGVNLDQELINLTTYQQAYNASARLIQAAKDMYDVLLGMMN